jgi:hypothetical protein
MVAPGGRWRTQDLMARLSLAPVFKPFTIWGYTNSPQVDAEAMSGSSGAWPGCLAHGKYSLNGFEQVTLG